MKNLFRSKLTKRYLFISFIVILIALSSLYGMTLQVMNTSFQSQIEYRDDLITRTLSKRINFMLNKIINDMRMFSPYLAKQQESDRQFYLSEMQRLVGQEPLYLAILAFDSEGNRVASIPQLRLNNQLDLGNINRVLSWSQTYDVSHTFTLPSGNPSIAISYPAIDEMGRYRGGVAALVNLGVFSQYLEELKIGEEGMNFMMDTEGEIIAHSNKAYRGTSLDKHPIAGELKKERYGLWVGELFDKEMIVSYRPLFLGRFGLVVAEPVNQANAPAREVSILLLRGFIVVLSIAAILTLFGTSRVVRPILKLIKQAVEYKENRRNQFEPIETMDELEDLSLVLGQMAKELTEKERNLFYILESIPYCVITTDQSGKIRTFNKGAEDLTCFSREEVTGKFIFEIPLKPNKEEFLSWKTLQEGKQFNDLESYIFDKHKVRHDVRLYSSLLYGEDGKLIGSIIVMRDVSEMKQLEEYVKQKEKLASLGQLTAGIAHEIKNPLSIVQAAAEAIEFETEKWNLRETTMLGEFTQDLFVASERMNRLLTNFLNLGKGDQGQEKEGVNLVSLINELLHLLRKNLNDQGIALMIDLPVKEAWVYGNKSRLAQVFLNIILNSIQSMEEKGGTLSVRLSEMEQDWNLEVEDTGRGIPRSKIQWIFNPFYSTKREGTGLGLSISHEIITQHQGKIWAISTEGTGTTLFVRLPKLAKEEITSEKYIAG